MRQGTVVHCMSPCNIPSNVLQKVLFTVGPLEKFTPSKKEKISDETTTFSTSTCKHRLIYCLSLGQWGRRNEDVTTSGWLRAGGAKRSGRGARYRDEVWSHHHTKGISQKWSERRTVDWTTGQRVCLSVSVTETKPDRRFTGPSLWKLLRKGHDPWPLMTLLVSC